MIIATFVCFAQSLLKPAVNKAPFNNKPKTFKLKGTTSRLAQLEKLSLEVLTSSFVIQVNLFHP